MIAIRSLALATALALAPSWSASATTSFSLDAPAAGSRMETFLRPLGATREALLFAGEAQSRTLPVFVSADAAARASVLELSVLTAIAADPELSLFSVSLNGRALGERALTGFDDPERFVFEVPPGLLVPGYNALRLDVRHTHRVDCSLEATYELWTSVVPQGSGFVVRGARVDDLDLASLPGMVGSDGRARLAVAPTLLSGPRDATRAARVIRAVSALARFDAPLVGPIPDGEIGIEIVVGHEARLRALGVAPPEGRGPRVAIVSSGGDGRVRLVVTGDDESDLEAALSGLERRVQATRPVGSPEGLRAHADAVRRIEGSGTLTLADLGIDPQAFAGRYLRASGRLDLPGDFYPGEYDRVTVVLDAAYAAGLSPDSELSFRVNGTPAASLPLARAAGDVLRERSVHLPLSLFRPGRNTISLEARLAAPEDLACEPGATSRRRDRLVVSGASRVHVPRLARALALPEIASSSNGAFDSSAERVVYVPRGDRAALSGALTLLAVESARTGSTSPVVFDFGRPDSGSGHALVFAGIDDVDDDLLARVGLPARELRGLWGSRDRPVVSQVRPIVVASGDTIVLPVLEESIDGAATAPSLLETLSSGGDGAMTALFEMALADGLGLRDEVVAADEASVLQAGTRLVLAQGLTGRRLPFATDAGGWSDVTGIAVDVDTLTLVVAPSARTLAQDISDLFLRRDERPVSGAIVAFDPESDRVASARATSEAVALSADMSPGNLRLVFSAWLSRHVDVYLAILALLVVFASGFVYAALRLTGGRAR